MNQAVAAWESALRMQVCACVCLSVCMHMPVNVSIYDDKCAHVGTAAPGGWRRSNRGCSSWRTSSSSTLWRCRSSRIQATLRSVSLPCTGTHARLHARTLTCTHEQTAESRAADFSTPHWRGSHLALMHGSERQRTHCLSTPVLLCQLLQLRDNLKEFIELTKDLV
jgi:hypothetical protein